MDASRQLVPAAPHFYLQFTTNYIAMIIKFTVIKCYTRARSTLLLNNNFKITIILGVFLSAIKLGISRQFALFNIISNCSCKNQQILRITKIAFSR